MEQTEDQHLFDIKLTASGKNYLRKFAVNTRMIIVCALVVVLVNVTVVTIVLLRVEPPLNDNDLVLQHKLLPYYTALYCILNFPLLYLYWQVTTFLRKGINHNDEETLNKAFASWYRYSLIGVASVMLSLLNYGFELYWYVKHYLK